MILNASKADIEMIKKPLLPNSNHTESIETISSPLNNDCYPFANTTRFSTEHISNISRHLSNNSDSSNAGLQELINLFKSKSNNR